MFSPTFPFDVPGWRSSRHVQKMSATTRGLYLEMLIEQWDHGAAPATPEECAAMLGLPLKDWRTSWPQLRGCFRERKKDRKLVNRKMDALRRGRKKFIEGQRTSGSIGGKVAQEKRLAARLAKGSQKGSLPCIDLGLGSVDLGSVELKKDQRLRRDVLARLPAADGNYAIIERIAHEVLAVAPDSPIGELVEGVKELCAKRLIDYGGNVVHRAVESAVAQARRA